MAYGSTITTELELDESFEHTRVALAQPMADEAAKRLNAALQTVAVA